MSVLQVSNVVFESTANNRVQYGGTNNINIVVGGTTALIANTSQVTGNLPIYVGANAFINTSAVFIGNSTVNATINTSALFIGNSTVNVSITQNTLRIGNSSVGITFAANGNVGLGGNSTPTVELYVNGSAAGAVGTLS